MNISAGSRYERITTMQDNQIMYFKDENGNELPLAMIDAFDFNDDHYALFVTPEENLGEDEEPAMYIMKPVIQDGEIADFTMPTDEEMEAVTPFLINRLEQRHSCGGSCSSCGCGCGDHDHDDCGCEHEHEHEECSCGHCH